MTLLVLGQRQFNGVLDAVPALSRKMLAAMATRLREADEVSVRAIVDDHADLTGALRERDEVAEHLGIGLRRALDRDARGLAHDRDAGVARAAQPFLG